MTSREMLYHFQKLITTSDPSLINDRLESYEIYTFINLAQKKVFKERYFPGGDVKSNIIIINNNTEETKNLIQSVIINNITGNLSIDLFVTYSYTFDYSFIQDYAHYIRSESIVSRVNVFPTTSSLVSNKLITNLEVESHITNIFHSPIIRKPAILIENDTIMRVFVDKYTTNLEKIKLTYLRYPVEIDDNVSCELSENLHSDIVSVAVDLFRANKYMLMQSKDNDTNNKEK